MKKMELIVAGVVAAGAISGSDVASAATRTLYIGTESGNAVTLRASTTVTAASTTLTWNGTGTYSGSTATVGDQLGDNPNSQSQVNQGVLPTVGNPSVHSFTYVMSETGLAQSPNPVEVDSIFSSSRLRALANGTSQTITETTYFYNGNVAFAGAGGNAGTQLETWTFNATNWATNQAFTDYVNRTGEFTITQVYTFYSPSRTLQAALLGQVQTPLTPNNTGPIIPETSTWAMMGMGFAGLAFAGYTRRRKARAIVA